MRAVRIGRVCTILDTLSNLAQALGADPGEWEKGTLVGITIDLEELVEEDQALVNTYRSLDVPVEGPLPEDMPPVVSREEARTILFGKSKAKATKLPDETDLPERDDDTLFYADIQPDHDAQGLTADGRHKSDAELREQQEDEFIHKYQEAHEVHEESNAMDIDPAPPYTLAEPATAESFAPQPSKSLLAKQATAEVPLSKS